MKINLQQLGYAVGVLVCFPLLLYLANLFFFSGSKEVNEYIPKYIEECIIDSVEIDKNYESGHKTYFSGLRRRGKGIHSVDWITFYSKEHQKYLSLMIFAGGIATSYRQTIIHSLDPAIVKVLVNPKQLNSSTYGSKENPVPVFGLDVMNAGENGDEMRQLFHADDREIYGSIERYLKFIISKKEFKQVFKEKQSSRE